MRLQGNQRVPHLATLVISRFKCAPATLARKGQNNNNRYWFLLVTTTHHGNSVTVGFLIKFSSIKSNYIEHKDWTTTHQGHSEPRDIA